MIASNPTSELIFNGAILNVNKNRTFHACFVLLFVVTKKATTRFGGRVHASAARALVFNMGDKQTAGLRRTAVLDNRVLYI